VYVEEGIIQPTISQTDKIREYHFRFFGEKGDTVTIPTVIHLDIPYSPEAYLQETGRAGRDGSPVEATLLYAEDDLEFAGILSTPSAQREAAGDSAATGIHLMAAERYAQMLGYALNTKRCRREQLLRGFWKDRITSSSQTCA
jgi:ATP-dependent DNA helicase RecQ